MRTRQGSREKMWREGDYIINLVPQGNKEPTSCCPWPFADRSVDWVRRMVQDVSCPSALPRPPAGFLRGSERMQHSLDQRTTHVNDYLCNPISHDDDPNLAERILIIPFHDELA